MVAGWLQRLENTLVRKLMNNGARLPNFIIVGAMKAGTTSMHHILNPHNNVFIPGREIYFFDIDDVEQHPDFSMDDDGKWTFRDWDRYWHDYLDWYQQFFQRAADGQVIGEDSTTYMASSKAPARIAELLPNVKLIFMLRDPVTRAYSHYWHMVNSGRAIYDFEVTLLHAPGTILQRGYYKEQIKRFMQYFPGDQLKVVVFEEFTKNIQAIVDDVCKFLGLRVCVDTRAVNTHRNIGKAPRSLRLKLRANRINRKAAERIYQGRLPTPGTIKKKLPSGGRSIAHISPTMVISRIVNRTPKLKYPPMASGVRTFLEQLYAKENMGLGDLIGIDIERYWPYMRYHG
jgi:Sulfotransferase family